MCSLEKAVPELFSDGKLNTLVKDKYGRNTEVLKTFVKHGADPAILYQAKPHIGTDVLSKVVKACGKKYCVWVGKSDS